MKIYKLIIINLETMEIEKQVSYDYHGPVALCCGGDGDGDGGPGSAEAGFEGAQGMFGGQQGMEGDFGALGPDPSGVDTSFLASSEDFAEPGQTVAEAQAQVSAVATEELENKAKWASAIGKAAYAAIVAALALVNPMLGMAGAIAAPIAKKGIDALAASVAQNMTNDPSMSTEEAVGKAFDEHGSELGSEYTAPEVRQQMTEYIVNTVGEKNPVTVSPEESKLHSEYIGDAELALLNQMEANEIQKFTDQVMERSRELNEFAVADLVNRGVLQSSVGAQVLSDLNEDTLEIIAQGTTDIQTQRMGSELSLIQQGKGMAWEKEKWGETLDLEKYWGRRREDALEDANKWNAFGNVAGGVIGGMWGQGGTDWSKYF